MELVLEFENTNISIVGLLNESSTSKAIHDILPIQTSINLWGEEIYFPIDLFMDNESAQDTVEIGSLAYWPPGNAFCIFFGETPASINGDIRPASAVTVIGKLQSDPLILKSIKSGEYINIRRKNDTS